jgi:hypothetical protein
MKTDILIVFAAGLAVASVILSFLSIFLERRGDYLAGLHAYRYGAGTGLLAVYTILLFILVELL